MICSSATRDRSHRRSSDGFGGHFLGGARVTSSTIDVGSLGIGLFDAAIQQLVWRGSTTRTLDLNKDPDKSYRNLEKAMANLFRNYPPDMRKR